MRVAFFSPLNPQRSGISDYSEELLPYLAAHARIDLVTNGYQPSNPEINNTFTTLTPDQFLSRKTDYDCVLYQIGNHPDYHGYMARCMRHAPGIVVLHDYSLSYLMLGLTLERGDLKALERILAATHGKDAGPLARQILLGRVDPYQLSLARPIIEMSNGVIVHNLYAHDKLKQEYPHQAIRVVRHATPIRQSLGDKAELRRKYGFAQDDFLIASVSRLAYNKRFELAFSVLADIVRLHPQAKLLLVGEGQLSTQASAMIAALNLDSHIHKTGFVSAEAYLAYIDMADAAIDLRFPTAGETSGGSLRLLQAAKPVVASAQGFFLELPKECCLVIPVDANERQAIVQAMRSLIEDPAFRTSVGDAARSFALNYLTREEAAAGYVSFMRQVIAENRRPLASWDLDTPPTGLALGVRTLHTASRTIQFARQYGPLALARRIKQQVKPKP